MDDTRAIVKALEAQGWRVEAGKHYKAYSPDGVTIVVFAKTPSDSRSMKNAISQLRKGGFQWPPPKRGRR